MGKIKTVFITGGGSGIGKAIVERFAKEVGYFVCFTYNSNSIAAKEITTMYANTLAIKCNITNSENVSQTLQKLKEQNILIDVLINCAGIVDDSSFLKMSEEKWVNVINTNLISLFSFTQKFLSDMIVNGWGRIINMSSISGVCGLFGQTNYSSSKAGVIGFTKALALETAKKKITVNAVAPGMIDTDMIKAIPQLHMDKILNDIPMKRLGKPEEIADLVFFLASENASYITGQVIGINGGMHL